MAAKSKKSRICLRMWDFFCTFAPKLTQTNTNIDMTIDTTNMCSHLQRKLFEGEYRAITDPDIADVRFGVNGILLCKTDS
jgi:hypothetical protein